MGGLHSKQSVLTSGKKIEKIVACWEKWISFGTLQEQTKTI